MKTVLKISALALSVAAANSFAATATADPDADGDTLSFTAAAGNYVQTDFEYALSSNVGASVEDDTVKFAVASAHAQGRYSFAGDSDGGTVASCEAEYDADGFGATAVTVDVDNPCNGRS